VTSAQRFIPLTSNDRGRGNFIRGENAAGVDIGLVDPTVSPLVAAVDRSACAQISKPSSAEYRRTSL
jgi:hypothetical protein